MIPDDVINATQEKAGEWLEMSEDPAAMLAGLLAKDIIRLTEYINYLEKRLEHVGNFTTTRSS